MNDPDLQTGPDHARRCFWVSILVSVGLRVLIGVLLACWELAAPTPAHEDTRYYHRVQPQLSVAGQLFVKYDSYWYLDIAEHGYRTVEPESEQSNLAFAPLYPGLIHLLFRCGVPAWIGGVGISAACYVLLLYYLFQLGTVLKSPRLGGMLMILVSAFPSAWVLHMVYAEAMFCLCLAAFLTYYLRGHYGRAGLCGLLLPHIRIAGLCLALAIAADLCYTRWRHKQWSRAWISLLMSVFGIGVLCLVYTWLTGSPAAFAAAGRLWFDQAGVQGRFFPLIHSFIDRLGQTPLAYLYLIFLVVYSCGAFVILKRRRDLGGWFAVLYLLMLLKTPLISAQLRYLLPLLPVHALFADLSGRRQLFVMVIILLLLIQLFVTRFELTWNLII